MKEWQRRLWITAAVVAIATVGLSCLLLTMTWTEQRRIARSIRTYAQIQYVYSGPAWIPNSIRTRINLFDRPVGVRLISSKVPLDVVRDIASMTTLKELDLHDSVVTNLAMDTFSGPLTGRDYMDLKRKVWSDGLEYFEGNKNLEYLRLDGTSVTSAGLVHLKGMSSLRRLNIGYTDLGNDALQHLWDFPSLEQLNLQRLPIDDAGLEQLQKLTGLKSLTLEGTEVTDEGLTFLKALTSLEVLDLTATQITDQGLASLGALQNLKSLQLSYTAIRGTGIRLLQKLPRLTRLDLNGTRLNKAGIESLGNLSKLTYLDLKDSVLPEDAREELRAMLPNCRITFDLEHPASAAAITREVDDNL